MNADIKSKNLDSLKPELKTFLDSCSKNLEKYQDHLHGMRERAEKISESWSGSWVGFHARLYYGKFEKPTLSESFDIEWGSINGFSDKWQERSFDEVKKKIEEGVVKHHFEYVFKKVKSLVKQAVKIREKLVTELSYVNADDSLTDEKGIIEQIEKIGFGTSADRFVKNLEPMQSITRDSRAVSEGMKVPPHVKYKAQVMAVQSMISDIERFGSLSSRLVRQLEIKSQIDSQGEDFVDSLEKIKILCDRFHAVSRQLRSRYNNRPTLEVEDEYDVQDLLHALLKVYFDDIRKEEWTPSYAGSSSRVDFLIKQEKLVIEVKRTRGNLRDRQVGEQLILDIAKYKEHPDCKTLVCFVYDPEGRISNATGLITDISKQSSKELTVILIIKP